MSGASDICECPRCGFGECQTYYDWKPFTTYEYTCPICGFLMVPQMFLMTKEELKEYRHDHEIEGREMTDDEKKKAEAFDKTYRLKTVAKRHVFINIFDLIIEDVLLFETEDECNAHEETWLKANDYKSREDYNDTQERSGGLKAQYQIFEV